MTQNLKSQYLAFVLTEASRVAVLRAFPPKFSRVICHHITVQFNLDAEALQSYKEEFLDTELEVVGYVADESLEALVVSINGSTRRRDGSIYHITLSLEPPRKPVDSNKLVQTGEAQRVFGEIEAELKLEPK
jgi:predicted acyltransferase (DUF342 family)